jgi:hypothetical protein
MVEGNMTAERNCYTDIKTRKLVALVMLHDCCNIFDQISALRTADRTHKSDKTDNQLRRNPSEPALTSDSQDLADMMRIAICFEMFFKAKLLLYGFLIHHIDENTDQPLAVRQPQFPIKISEVNGEVFNTLSVKTIGWEILEAEAYRRQLDMPSRLLKSLESIVELRRNFQPFKSGQKAYNRVPLHDLLYIRMCYRELVVKLHNDLLAQLEESPAERISLGPELQGRKTAGTALRAFCHKLAGVLR